MTAKTRYFFVGSALILVLGLSVGLVAYYGGVPGRLFAAGPGPEELAYVPENAAVVAYANVQDVMKSELRQRLIKLEGSPEKSSRDEFRTETGIDIEQDIDHVIACVAGRSESGHDPNGLVLARGRFDASRLEALAVGHGAVVGSYKGRKLFSAIGSKHEGVKREAHMAMAFIEPGLVAIGSPEMLRRAIDTKGAGADVRKNAQLMKLVGDMGNASVWAVGDFESIASQAHLSSEVTGRIPPIAWFAASGHVNGGLQATLKAEAKTAEAAENLRDIIRGFTALAKMQAGSRPETQAMFPDVRIEEGTGQTVSVSFAVSSALLDLVTAAHDKKRIEQREKIEKKIEKKIE